MFLQKGTKVRAIAGMHALERLEMMESWGEISVHSAEAVLAGRCLLDRNAVLAACLSEVCGTLLFDVVELIARSESDAEVLDAYPDLCSALARVASESASDTSAWVEALCSELMQECARAWNVRLAGICAGRRMPEDMLREMGELAQDMASEHKRLKGLRSRMLEAANRKPEYAETKASDPD